MSICGNERHIDTYYDKGPNDIPPSYAALPTTTSLQEEPNPFEQSFEIATTIKPEISPPTSKRYKYNKMIISFSNFI